MSWVGDVIDEEVKQSLLKDLRDNLVRVKGIYVDGYGFTIELPSDFIQYYELATILRAVDGIGFHVDKINMINGNFSVQCEMD